MAVWRFGNMVYGSMAGLTELVMSVHWTWCLLVQCNTGGSYLSLTKVSLLSNMDLVLVRWDLLDPVFLLSFHMAKSTCFPPSVTLIGGVTEPRSIHSESALAEPQDSENTFSGRLSEHEMARKGWINIAISAFNKWPRDGEMLVIALVLCRESLLLVPGQVLLLVPGRVLVLPRL